MKTSPLFCFATLQAPPALLVFTLAALGFNAQPDASAADFTWDITPGSAGVGNGTIDGGSGSWNLTNGNWSTDGGSNNVQFGNTFTDNAIFTGTAGTVDVDAAISVQNITFNSSGYSIVDTGTAGSLTLAGTSQLSVTTAGHTASISEILAGGATSLIKVGAGTLTLSGANTFSGVTNITAGNLTISDGSALGSTTSNTVVGTGATLELTGGITTSAEALSLTGTLSSQSAGTNTYAGVITLNANSSFDVGTGSTLAVSAAAVGTGAWAKNGAGTLRFNSDPNQTGALTLNSGVVELNLANGFIDFNTTIENGGTLRLLTNDDVGDSYSITVNTGGTLDMRANDTIQRLTGGGTVTRSTTGTSTLTLNSSTNATFDGVIQNGAGTLALVKSNTNTVTLTGANTYTGTTSITRGTLALDFSPAGGPTSNILASGNPLAFNSSTAAANTGTLTVTGAASETNSQTFVSTSNNSGVNTLSFTSGASGTLNANLGTISRGTGTLNIVAPDSGSLTTSNSDGLLAWATYTSAGTTSLAKITGGTLGAATPDFTYQTGTDISNLGGYTTGGVLLVDNTSTGEILQAGGNTAIGSLQYSDTSNRTAQIAAGETLQFANTGAILVNSTAGNLTLGSTVGEGSLTAGTSGSGELIVHNLSSSTTVTINSVITDNAGAGAVSLTKAGVGTLVLNGGNTHTGATSVEQGTLEIRHNNALGATTGTTTVRAGAALALSGDITTGAEPLSLVGNGVSTTGALRNLSGNNTYGGTVTLSGDATLSSTAGTLTIDTSSGNAVTAGNNNITFSGAGNIVLNDPLDQTTSNNRTFTKSGTGTLSLNAANTFTGNGAINITGGTLNIGHVAALPTSGRSTFISTGGGSGTLQLSTDTSVNPYLISSNSTYSGTIISDRATPGAGITHALGAASLGANTFNFRGGNNVTSGTAGISLASVNLFSGTTGTTLLNPTSANLTVVGAVNIGTGAVAKTLNLGGTSTGNALQGNVSDNLATLSLIKSNSSTWRLSGTNSFTGTTEVTGGTLRLDYTTNNTNKLADGAALTLGGGTLELAGGSHAETVLSTTLTSGTSNTITRSSGTALLHLNTITVGAGAQLHFTAPNIATTDNTNTNGILGGWATITSGGGTEWAVNSTNSADGLITPFAGAYTDITRLGTSTLPNTPSANVRITNGGTSGDITLGGGALTEINTLRMDASDGPATLNPGANTDLLKIGGEAGGGIIQTPTSGGLTVGTLADDGVLTTGGTSNASQTTLALVNNHTTNDLTINSSITDNGTDSVSLTTGGAGRVVLAGTNSFTGPVVIHSGTLHVGATSSTTNGTLGGNTPIVNNGTLVFRRSNTTSTDVAGAISGTGSVTYEGTGGSDAAQYSVNTASTYSGATTIAVARATVSNATGFGTGPVTVLDSGSVYVQAALANDFVVAGNGWLESAGNLGAIRMNNSGVLNGNVTLAADTRFTADNGSTGTINGVITGSFGVNIAAGAATTSGNGNVRFNGANTYTGITTINGTSSSGQLPTLIVGHNNALGTTTNGTIVMGSNSTTAGTRLQLAAGVTVTDETLTLDPNGQRSSLHSSNAGTATWDGNIILQNTGQAAIWSDNINNVLIIGATSADTITSLNRNLTLRGTQGTGTVHSTISLGTGSLNKTDSSTWTLTNPANTYSGGTSISTGTLSFGTIANSGTSSSIGSGTTISIGQNSAGTVGVGTLRFTGNSGGSTNRTLNINNGAAGGGGILENTIAGQTLTFSGNITTTTPASLSTLTVQGAGNTTLSGNVTGSPAMTLTKSGNGTLRLSGNNTYTGATTVTAGTLVVSDSGSINSSSGVTVGTGATFRYNSSTAFTSTLILNTGATLSGTGNLGAVPLTVASGVTLSPGNSPGTLSTGAQTWEGDGNYLFEINSVTLVGGDQSSLQGNDPGADFLSITGALTITATNVSPFNINIAGLNLSNNAGAVNLWDANKNYSWVIASASGGISAFSSDKFNLDTSDFTNNNALNGLFGITTAGNDLVLTYTAVPEPSAPLLLLFGIVFLSYLTPRHRQPEA